MKDVYVQEWESGPSYPRLDHFCVTIIFTPRACAGVKWLVVSSLLSWTQKSLNLEMYAPERVVSTTNMSKNRLQYAQNRMTWPASYKSCILVGHRSHAHSLCLLCIMHVFLLMHTTGLVRVGKGRQHHMSKLHDNADARRARGMCS